MAGKTNIEWTTHTWNPIVGCSVKSPGCTHCYAMRLAKRLGAMGNKLYDGLTKDVNGHAVFTGEVRKAPRHTLLDPLRRKKPTTYFVNSMSDLFHENVPDAWIDEIFAVMALCPQHTFQVLTKRARRMREYFDPTGCVNCGDGQLDGKCCDEPCVLKDGDGAAFRDAMIEGASQKIFSQLHPGMGEPSEWLAVHMPLSNVWLGVSTERQQEADERIPELLKTPATVRFISAEPLLGPLDLTHVSFGEGDPRHKRDVLSGQAYMYCEGRDGHPDFTLLTKFEKQMPRLDWVIVGGESGHGHRPMDEAWAASLMAQCEIARVPVFVKQMAGRAPIPEHLRIRQFPRPHPTMPVAAIEGQPSEGGRL